MEEGGQGVGGRRVWRSEGGIQYSRRVETGGREQEDARGGEGEDSGTAILSCLRGLWEGETEVCNQPHETQR